MVRLAVFAGIAIVTLAAIVSLGTGAQPVNAPNAISSAVLVVAVAIQRIGSVQRWMAKPRKRRESQVHSISQTTLIELCRGKAITEDLLCLRIHVWEVPLWYRRIFPYHLRLKLEEIAKLKFLRFLTAFSIKPALRRVAVAGLLRKPPSGVKFRKGVGIVGICVEMNKDDLLVLDTSHATYQDAIKANDEVAWAAYGVEVTRGLTLADARKLSGAYGQVVGKVVQSMDSGEAIGCITVSVRTNAVGIRKVARGHVFQNEVNKLAVTAAELLS